jgi:error-prone DNA polymerase
MPDPRPAKHRPSVASKQPVGRAPQSPRYAELHCRTNYSFLEGASHPEELVQRAAELGYAALAITDRHSLAGVVRAHVAARTIGLKLLIGAEIAPADAGAVVLLALDRNGYGRLSQLLTRGRRAAPKGECHLCFDDIAEHAGGLLACVLPGQGATASGLVRYREVFADRCYALAELHRGPDDRRQLQRLLKTARQARVPIAAANDVHYHCRERQPLQEVLTAVRHGCTVAELGERRFPNAERHLQTPQALAELFAGYPEALQHGLEAAQRCQFSLAELKYEYPEELCPAGLTPLVHLTQLTWAGAVERYPLGVPDKVRCIIEHELCLIEELHYEGYFLTVWDIMRFARGRDILCQGRGSAANSAVCFCLGITAVDPDRIDVLFERFVSKERSEAPDIDVDFEHERREEVLQYIYEKYGRERAAMTAEVITYRSRSAVRDVGKALGLSLDRVDALAKALDQHDGEEKLAGSLREAGLDLNSALARHWLELVRQLLGFPRHLSQHVGGMVITHGPLSELVPIENAAMPGRTVIQWDKDDLDALGILKIDCLALGMLTAIHRCFDLVARHGGRPLTLADVPAEDPAVYDMVSRADTIGVFQIESRAQMSMLPRLKPRCYYDLVIEVALVRPGPIQGDMVHPYLRRRNGEEKAEYPDDRLRAVLEKTLGVPLFQEQAMRLAVVAAGFTPGEAEQLRRTMGAWRKRGVLEPLRQKLVNGMIAKGYAQDFAERVYRQLQGFGEYGFPESHAASFALLVYVSAWLKCYYPAAFAAALLNSQPMGFYAPAQLVADARNHGIEVRGVDVNRSDWDCTLEPVGSALALRLGFCMIHGLGVAHAESIVRQRHEAGSYASFPDFLRRTRLSSVVLKRLARADAFGSLGLDRRAAMWQALPEPARGLLEAAETPEPEVELPAMSSLEEVMADYGTAGLSLRQHPMAFLRPQLQPRGVVSAGQLADLPNGGRVQVAGVVLMRQRPGTARGITFVTLEDETGMTQLIIRPEVWQRYRRIAHQAVIMLASGPLQKAGSVIHVLVAQLEDLSPLLAELRARSRDFH